MLTKQVGQFYSLITHPSGSILHADSQLKNREATRQRKLDTRRKVILGGALLDLAERDTGAASMLDRLIRNLPREQDRKAFADWGTSSGSPSPAPSGSDPETPS